MNTRQKHEYLLLFHGSAWYNKLSPEELQQVMSRFQEWMDGMNAKGILKAAQPLARDGKTLAGKPARVVADGPFAESKEAIAGYFLLAVDSFEEAVEIARSCPTLEYGQIDVRPVADDCPLASRARLLQPAELAVA